MNYAMILRNRVIEVLYEQTIEPRWPPDYAGNPVSAVLCDDTVERGMVYDSDTGEFTWPVYVTPEATEESEAEPTQLDRIEAALSILTADTVTAENISAAISEGVNEV